MSTINLFSSIKHSAIVVCFLMLTTNLASAQNIVINEVNQAGQWVELYNASSTTTTNVSDWILCDFPRYDDISALTILSGDMNMPPNSYLVISWPVNGQGGINSSAGEVGLYIQTSNFGSPANIRDYMQYGSGNQTRASVAVSAGVWDVASTAVPNATTSGNSLVMIDEAATGPTQTASGDWAEGSATQGSTNFPLPPLLTVNDDPITPDTYEAQVIESSGRVADNGIQEVIFSATMEIRFFAEFTIDSGGLFLASIQ